MELYEKFLELYEYIAGGRDVKKMRTLGGVMKWMMQDLCKSHPDLADEYLAILESVKWDNYLTEKEAETIVNAMSPEPRWSKAMPQWEKQMENLGWDMEHYPCYNKCALYVTMCMVDSDDRETITELMGKASSAPDLDYFKAVHRFALNKLKDKDGVFNIRRYFKDVLWPEKKQSR